MGLDDEAEKLRQAEEWIRDGTAEQRSAAHDQIGHVLVHSDRRDLRKKAWDLIHLFHQRERAL
jgi:hypothetical protein